MSFSKAEIKEFFRPNIYTKLIQISYFLFSLSTAFRWPFLSLQMRKIGLSLSDVGLIAGIHPLVNFITNPILGYIGDKFGYKRLLIVSIIIIGASTTCFDLTPRYSRHILRPKLNLSYLENDTSTLAISSIAWPDQRCFINNDLADYRHLTVINKNDFERNIIEYLYCDEKIGTPSIDVLMTQLKINLKVNNTFNLIQNAVSGNSHAINVSCVLKHPEIASCEETEGSHIVTFLTYLGLRTLFQVFMTSAYNILDATSAYITKKHNSDYSKVMWWTQLSHVIGPFLAGVLVKDDGVDTSYQTMYYTADVISALSCIFICFLTIHKEETKESAYESAKKFIKVPILFILAFNIIIGFNWGLQDTYIAILLQEDYHVSSQFIGNLVAIGGIMGVISTPFGKTVVKIIGRFNLLFVCVLTQSSRFVIWTFMGEIPEIAYGLAVLDIFAWGFQWIASISYAFDLAPVGLVGTMTSLIGAMQYVLGKGLGASIGGILMDHTFLTKKDVFRLYAGVSFSSGFIMFLIYYVWIKKEEDLYLKVKEDEVKRNSEDNTLLKEKVENL